MILPDKFKADIQSKNLNIITRVIIDNRIFLSTHNMNWDDNHYKPLLLNIPSMKESVDIEKRNFKISNVTLSISNYKVDGERFSDLLLEDTLFNKEVDIFWQTQSARAEEDCVKIYNGQLKRIKHDENKVSIQVEDYTQQKFSKTLPTTFLSNSGSIQSRFRGKPIPMAYGVLDNAPVVIDGDIIKADTEPVNLLYSTTSIDYYVGLGEDGDFFAGDSVLNADFYQPHPAFGDFIDFYPHQPSSKTVPPLKMVEDGIEIYIPSYNQHSIVNENFDNWESEPGQVQWHDLAVGISGQIKLIGMTASETSFGETYSEKLIEGFPVWKSSSVGCHFNGGGGTASIGYTGDGNGAWEYSNRFKSVVTKYLGDNEYDKWWLIDYNDFEPMQEWVEFITLLLPGGGAEIGSYNQTLMNISINTDLPFDTVGRSDESQIAVNEFIFPLMSKIQSDNNHSLYVLSHTKEDLEGNITIVGGYEDILVNAYNQYTYGCDFEIIDLSDNVNDYFPSVGWNQNPDRYFKDLFAFTDYLDDDGYSGWHMDSDPDSPDANSEGYTPDSGQDFSKALIYIKDTNVSVHEGQLEFMGGEDNPPDFPTMFVQVNNLSKVLGEYHINIGWVIQPIENLGEFGGWALDYKLTLGGEWSEVDLIDAVNMSNPLQRDYYLNIVGRLDEAGTPLRNPIAIMRDIVVNELGFGEDIIDTDSYDLAIAENDDITFAFSITKKIDSKKLLEDMARYTLCFPFFNNVGKLKFPTIMRNYSPEDYDKAIPIKEYDIIKYSFDKTKTEHCYTNFVLWYKYDYITEDYTNVWASDLHINDAELNYSGYETADDNVLERECPYITDDHGHHNSARETRQRIFRHHKFPHIIAELTLPVSYIELEVGSIIKFTSLVDGVHAYGIDYTKVIKPVEDADIYGSYYYPMFFVIEVNKSLDKIKIKAIQLHHLSGGYGFEVGSSWDNSGLLDFEEELEEIDVDQISDDIAMHTMSSVFLHTWTFINPTHTPDINNWLSPLAWGLTSFNDLTPTDFSLFSESQIRNFTALEMIIRGDEGETHTFRLKNVSDSSVDIQWGWEYEDWNGNVTQNLAEPIGDLGEYVGEYGNMPEFDVLFYSIGGMQYRNSLRYGIEFMMAFDLGLLPNHPSDTEGLTLNVAPHETWVFTQYDTGFGWGDVNLDGNLDILDIVVTVTHILGISSEWTSQQEDFADVNGDGAINILDVMEIMLVILDEG